MAQQYDSRVASFLEQLIDRESNRVKFRTLAETHEFLCRRGFKLAWKQEYGPTNGWQLFYHGSAFRGAGEGMIVRIKTHGEKQGPRAFKPHLSVTWQQGISKLDEEKRDYLDHEKGKFNSQGILESKSPPIGTRQIKDAWADRTHPLFPGFERSCETNPLGLFGAESLHESGGSA